MLIALALLVSPTTAVTSPSRPSLSVCASLRVFGVNSAELLKIPYLRRQPLNFPAAQNGDSFIPSSTHKRK